MKNKCSKEVKIMIAAMALMLVFFTAVVVNQLFENEPDSIKFIYNLTSEQGDCNINF